MAPFGADAVLPRRAREIRTGRPAHVSVHVNLNETFADEERDRTFEAAKALGCAGFSSSTVLSEARRLVPFAERHKMFAAMHNHNNLADPDQFATPGSFEKALAAAWRESPANTIRFN